MSKTLLEYTVSISFMLHAIQTDKSLDIQQVYHTGMKLTDGIGYKILARLCVAWRL